MAPDRLSTELAVGILVLSVSLMFMMRGQQFSYPLPTHFAAICLSSYLVGLVAFTPFINYARSSEEILAAAEGCSINGKEIVAVDSSNVYSHYWSAGAGTEELNHQLEIKFINRDQEVPQDVCYVMVNRDELANQLKQRLAGFEVLKTGKRWAILRRTQQLASANNWQNHHPLLPAVLE